MEGRKEELHPLPAPKAEEGKREKGKKGRVGEAMLQQAGFVATSLLL